MCLSITLEQNSNKIKMKKSLKQSEYCLNNCFPKNDDKRD